MSKLRILVCLLAGGLLTLETALASPWDIQVSRRDGYLLYEPPPPLWGSSALPVAVLLPGTPGLVQDWYYDWQARDLADAGHIVILPLYEGLPWEWYDDAVDKTRTALIDLFLGEVGAWDPDFNKFAVVGHSLGGIYALKLAHDAPRLWFPRPKAVVLHDAAGFLWLPYVSPLGTYPYWFTQLDGIDNDAVLVVIGAQETWQADLDAGFAKANALPVWLYAWHLTGAVREKRIYRVPGGHFGCVGFNGTAVYNSYRDITLGAFRAAFQSAPFPNPPGAERVYW